jgi:uncharacterized protein (TIGR03435 family)
MMNRRFFAALLAVLPAFAQTPDPLKFEVASLKPSGPQSVRGSQGGPGTKDPTRYRFALATLRDLIAVAWNVSYFQISSKSPVDKDSYDVIVNVPEGATREQFRQMMKNLLAERLELKSHMESKSLPAYELVIAKGGLKLKESGTASEERQKGDDRFPAFPQAEGMMASFSSAGLHPICRVRGRRQTTGAIAKWLRTPGNEPVVDKTGLTGVYDFTFEYALDTPAALADTAGPGPLADIFAALQEQLGLQLIAKKLPFEVVVVESFNRTPAEN